jgi:two-component system NtrC family sensor kinase
MMMEQEMPPSWSDYLTLMKSESDRIARIVNHLLRFSAKQRKNCTAIDIAAMLREVVADAVKRSATPQVTPEFSFAEDLPQVTVNADDLKTVINHLVDNACDAMPEGGQLRIAVRCSHAEDNASDNANCLIIDVADSGCGVAAKNVHKVFDPFFTTKDIGEGMGLSLAICYALVRSMGGTITFESHENHGTVFSIELPINADRH